MSTTIHAGQNISNAVHVLKETYRNLDLLFTDLDRVGEEEGFISITPRFLRQKSDIDSSKWLTTNFIKLYQSADALSLAHIPDMKDGYVYGVEIELEGQGFPAISLIRYEFDYSKWLKTPSVSDHFIFWDPFWIEKYFHIFQDEATGIWESTPVDDKAKDRYWGMQHVIAEEIPLLSVSSTEDIRIKVFEELRRLKAASTRFIL